LRIRIARLTAVLLGAVACISLAGCSNPAASVDSRPPSPVSLSANADANLGSSVIAVSADPMEGDDYSVQLVGLTFHKSSGDVLEDGQVVGTGLSAEFADGMARGFDLGFADSSDAEVAKKDAYLCAYVRYQLSSEGGQRDSVIPSSAFSAIDDRDDQLDLIHFSNKDEYINTAYPYAVVIFKTFYDSRSIELRLDGKPYAIDVEALKAADS
jgi:hypothetical protein